MLYESPNFRLETDELVATLWLDLSSRPDRTLTLPLVNELALLIDRVGQMRFLEALVIRGGTPDVFCRGVEAATWAGLKSSTEIAAAVMRGQELTRKIAELPMPSLAFVEGACESGGLEIAMACTHLIAVNRPAASFRLDSHERGLIPCWGGAYRLTAKAGAATARKLYRTGEPLDASSAGRRGIADVVLPEAGAEIGLRRLLARIADGKQIRKSVVQRVRTGLARVLAGNGAGRRSSPMSDHFDQLTSYRLRSLVECHVAERRAMCGLLANPGTRNRLNLVRDFVETVTGQNAVPIRRVGWLGAGADKSPLVNGLKARGLAVTVMASDAEWARGGDAENRLPVDLLLVPGEDPADVRRQLAVVAGRLSPRTAVALVGHSVTVGDVQDDLPNASAVVGLHCPEWSLRADLVELSAGPGTADDTFTRVESWLRGMKFLPLRVADQPGQVANTLLLAYLSEAVSLVADGFSPREIDRLATNLGFARPPLEWCDEIGFENLSTLTAQLQLARRDYYARPLLFQKFRPYGWRGKESREGFYRYGLWRTENEVARMALWRDHDRQTKAPYIANVPDALAEAGDRLLYRVMNEAARLADDEVAEMNQLADHVAALATGWPRSLGGPLKLADDTGLLRVVNRLHEFRLRYGERFRPAPELLRRTETGQRFTAVAPAPARPTFLRAAG